VKNWTRATIRLTFTAILLAGGVAWAYYTGPTTPATGAPPAEGTCADADVGCHSDFAVDSGSGVFGITALNSTPGQYTPGDTVDMRIDLQQAGQMRWGFQLTVINSAGDPVGTILRSEPTRTSVQSGQGGRQYLTHTPLGTDSNTANVSPGWTFKWRAPAAGEGAVTFYAAGNAADGDGTSLGDYVYTWSVVLTEGPQSVHESGDMRPESFALGPNHPNPFNAGTRIPFRLDPEAAGPVSIAIHDVGGRRIRTLHLGRYTGAGEHEIGWDGKDEGGAPVPSGTYLVSLITRAGSDSRKVTLLR